MISIPVKKTVYGPLTKLKDLEKAIAKSGQPFGVDWSGPASNVNPAWPSNITYYQYLGFGLHTGIDIPVQTGTEIFASADGKVVELSTKITAGLGIVIYHKELNLKTVYWHLQDMLVEVGQVVKEGDLIGHSDNTGYSLGPHLHFETKITDEHGLSIRHADPMPYFADNEMKRIISLENSDDQYLVESGRIFKIPDLATLSYLRDELKITNGAVEVVRSPEFNQYLVGRDIPSVEVARKISELYPVLKDAYEPNKK